MIKDLRLMNLRAFCAVAETGSFTAAAESLEVSKSAVSKLVTEYETLLGYALFSRTTRQVNLTEAGRTLLPSVRATLRFLDNRHEHNDAYVKRRGARADHFTSRAGVQAHLGRTA